MQKVKIVMTESRPGYPRKGETLEVDEARAERWCSYYGIAERAGAKKSAPKKDETPEPPPAFIPRPIADPDRSER